MWPYLNVIIFPEDISFLSAVCIISISLIQLDFSQEWETFDRFAQIFVLIGRQERRPAPTLRLFHVWNSNFTHKQLQRQHLIDDLSKVIIWSYKVIESKLKVWLCNVLLEDLWISKLLEWKHLPEPGATISLKKEVWLCAVSGFLSRAQPWAPPTSEAENPALLLFYLETGGGEKKPKLTWFVLYIFKGLDAHASCLFCLFGLQFHQRAGCSTQSTVS